MLEHQKSRSGVSAMYSCAESALPNFRRYHSYGQQMMPLKLYSAQPQLCIPALLLTCNSAGQPEHISLIYNLHVIR